MTLTEFLFARLAEDERYANAARGLLGIETPWHGVEALRERGLTRADAQHVARWDPTRVLAECEAKRQIVEEYVHARSAQAAGVVNPASIATEIAWEMACRLLALPCADHADYDPTWLASD